MNKRYTNNSNSLITDSLGLYEIYIITNKSKSEFISILSLVLCELLSTKMLEVEYKHVKKRVEAFEFRRGPKFEPNKIRPIDDIFMNSFNIEKAASIRAPLFFFNAIDAASNKRNLIRLGLKSSNLRKMVKFKFFCSLFGKIFLSKLGNETLTKINNDLKLVRDKLNQEINKKDIDHQEILFLLKRRAYHLQEFKIDQIFGKNYVSYLNDFNATGYDILNELNFAYFEQTLKLAHIQYLKLAQLRSSSEEYKTEEEYDDLDYDD